MSTPAIISVLNFSQAKGAEQLVLLRLASLINDDRGGCAWPGYRYLAKVTGYSKKHVMACAQALEKRSELRIVRRNGAKNLFYITVQPTGHLDGTSAVQVTPPVTCGDHPSVVQVTPYTLKNQNKNQFSNFQAGALQKKRHGDSPSTFNDAHPKETEGDTFNPTSAVQVTPPLGVRGRAHGLSNSASPTQTKIVSIGRAPKRRQGSSAPMGLASSQP